MEGFHEIRACERAHLGGAFERITHDQVAQVSDEPGFELFGDGLDDDEALGRDTTLAVVLDAREGRDRCGLGDVRVVQDHERVRAAQFEHDLLDRGAGAGGHSGAGVLTAGERDRRDRRVVDESRDTAGGHQ